MKPSIAISYTTPELKSRAEQLAEELNLPLTVDKKDYCLILTPDYLGLQKHNSKSKPLYVDFLSPQLQFRQHKATLKNESLARALGLKKNTHPTIVDATGGLARDSFILASLGFDVIILERSPIIHALIADGIARAHEALTKHFALIQADAIDWLAKLSPSQQPDIIYLDPMFGERKKSALPKQEMLIFQDIVGVDMDSKKLLTAALACAKQRVVVKRPRHADPMDGIKPTYSMTGSSCRFDVYLV